MRGEKQDTQTYKMGETFTDVGGSARHLGKAKMGKLISKGTAYRQLRLPNQHSDIIGDIAQVHETAYDGKQAFLVVTEQTAPNNSTVLKTQEKSLKPKEDEHGLKKPNKRQRASRGGVAWLSYGPVEATTRVRISPSALCFFDS